MKYAFAFLIVANLVLGASYWSMNHQAKEDAELICKGLHFDGAKKGLNDEWLCFVEGAPEDGQRSFYVVDVKAAADHELEALNIHARLVIYRQRANGAM